MFKQHRCRFGKNGKYLAWNYSKKPKRESRQFPDEMVGMITRQYVDKYFSLNSRIIQFAEVRYGY